MVAITFLGHIEINSLYFARPRHSCPRTLYDRYTQLYATWLARNYAHHLAIELASKTYRGHHNFTKGDSS